MGNVFVEICLFFELFWMVVFIVCIFDCVYVYVLWKFILKICKIFFFILVDIVRMMRKYIRIYEFL